MSGFSREQFKTVVTTYLMGTSHFEEQRSQPDVLGQLFCFAVRDVLEQEMQGSGRSRTEIVQDLAERTRDQVLPDTYRALAGLREEQFNRLYDAVLAVAKDSGLAWHELVEGLSAVNEIIDYFSKQQTDEP